MGDQREDAPEGLQAPQGPVDLSNTGEFERALQEYENAQHEQDRLNARDAWPQTPQTPERTDDAFQAPSAPHIDELPTGRLAPPPHLTGAPSMDAAPIGPTAPYAGPDTLEAFETMATEPVSAVEQPPAPVSPAYNASAPSAASSFSEMETDRLAAPVSLTAPNAPEAPGAGFEQRQPKTTRPIAEERFDPFDLLPQPWGDALAAEQAAPTGEVDSGIADLPTSRMHTAPPAFGAPRLEPPAATPATSVDVDKETTLPPRTPRPRLTAPPTPWNAGALADQRPPAAPPYPEPVAADRITHDEQRQGGAGGAPTWGQSPEQAGSRWAAPPTAYPVSPAPYPAPPVGYPSAGPISASERTPVLQRPTLTQPPTPVGAPPTTPWRRPTGAPLPPAMSPSMPPAAPEAPAPSTVAGSRPRPKRGASRVAIITLVVALVLASLGVGGAYLYGQQQAKAPTRVVNAYCAALTQANYQAAYALFLPAYQASISQQQYLASQALRDQLFGRVTSCSASLASQAGVFIFWRQPSLEVFNVTLARAGSSSAKHAATTLHGQVTLAPEGSTWLIGAVDLSLQSVDLDPLGTVSGFCSAMAAHDYAKAYAWLTPPYQQEQGGEPAFEQSFGSTLGITKCTAQPQTLSVSSNDRVATMQVTLTGYGAPPLTTQPINFTLPATITLTHLPAGWRIDMVTIQASSGQN